MPTIGYTSDQFFNLPTEVSTTEGLSPGLATNPAFAFPGGTRKVLNKNGRMEDQKVQRGFIRMLTQNAAGIDAGIMKYRRCFFQFNPSTITRAVAMTSEMLPAILQDPSQFSVPVPGQANFAFELLFDRTFEVNEPQSVIIDPSLTRDPSQDPFPTFEGAPNTDDAVAQAGYVTGSPNQIGVLADIRLLDSIVGQGISQDIIDYVVNQAKIINSYSTTNSTNASTGESTTTVDTQEFNENQAKTFLSSNIGNQAFLIPNPVRIVFSSLFMVDGFVQSMAVTFSKFSSTMVPLQCAVTLQVDARYIGFARDKTYLTDALSQAIPKAPSSEDPGPITNLTPEKDNPNSERCLSLMFKYFSQVYTSLGGTHGVYYSFPSVYSDEPPPVDYRSKDLNVKKFCGFSSPEMSVLVGSPLLKWDGDEKDDISLAFKKGEIIDKIQFNITLKITRDLTDAEKAEGEESKEINKGNLIFIDNAIITISNWDEWNRAGFSWGAYNGDYWYKYKKPFINKWHWTYHSGATKDNGSNMFFSGSWPNDGLNVPVNLEADIAVSFFPRKSKQSDATPTPLVLRNAYKQSHIYTSSHDVRFLGILKFVSS